MVSVVILEQNLNYALTYIQLRLLCFEFLIGLVCCMAVLDKQPCW